MNHPEITVVIPLYNKAPYIKRAIDSVLAQTINDFEIIVVNDGSTDGGDKIVEQYTDSRIHLINQNNQGVSAARNNGVNAARTELIAFLDSDDEYLPEYLETILRLRRNWPEAGIYGTAGYSCDLSNNIVKSNLLSYYDNNWEGEIAEIFSVSAKHGNFPSNTSSTAIVRQVFIENNGFNEKYNWGEDTDLFARICLNYKYENF